MTEPSQKSILTELQHDSEGQFFNIPTEFELSVTEVLLMQDGNRLVITPITEVALAERESRPPEQLP